MKQCTKCKVEYKDPIASFNKGTGKDGLRFRCKKCQKIYNHKYRSENEKKLSERDKNYYKANRERIKEKSSKYHKENKDKAEKYYQDNKEKISIKHKKWMSDNKEHVKDYSHNKYLNNKEAKKEYNKKYHESNRETLCKKSREYSKTHRKEINKYRRKKIKEDPLFRVRMNLGRRISKTVRLGGGKKAHKTMDLLGCSIEFFKEHMESKFEKGMTWGNYGKNGWHIDHIKPCAYFDLIDPEHQKKCFHYTNLQPLWAKDNFSKNSRYKGNTIRRGR